MSKPTLSFASFSKNKKPRSKESRIEEVMSLARSIRRQFADVPPVKLHISRCKQHPQIQLGFDNECSECLFEKMASIVGEEAATNFYAGVKVQAVVLSEICAEITQGEDA